MNKSEQINELAAALCKAQAEMKGATKDSLNPFFKSNYADLESVWNCIREPLTKHGLSVSQLTGFDDLGSYVETMLIHSSGQWLSGRMPIKAKDESPQAMGSAVSYSRRYSLAAICGVYQTDDDANFAQGLKQETKPVPRAVVPKTIDAPIKTESNDWNVITAKQISFLSVTAFNNNKFGPILWDKVKTTGKFCNFKDGKNNLTKAEFEELLKWANI